MKFWKKLPYGWKVCMAFILFFISTLSFAYFRGKHTVPNLGMESLEPNPEIVQSWEGKPRIVYFWANWCSVCKVYKPVLDANLSLIPKDTLFFRFVRQTKERRLSIQIRIGVGSLYCGLQPAERMGSRCVSHDCFCLWKRKDFIF